MELDDFHEAKQLIHQTAIPENWTTKKLTY